MNPLLTGASIAVLGGDDREVVLVKELVALGADVRVAGIPVFAGNKVVKCHDDLKDAVTNARFVVLPMPGVDEQGIIKSKYAEKPLVFSEQVMSSLRQDALIIVGYARPYLKQLAAQVGIRIVEIAEIDEVAILNSIPTAEGAVQMAMESSDITIHGSNVLILGFGRCGLTLARLVKAMGADTTIVARKPADLARAQEMGLHTSTFSQLDNHIAQADIIFNTVPALVLDSGLLKKSKSSVYICDLASAPGGVDFNSACELGLKARLAPGLPGKVAPRTAGLILAGIIPQIIINESSDPSAYPLSKQGKSEVMR